MDFDYLINSLNPEPVVQKKKKYSNFTIRPIGGPEEIIAWRQAQEAKEALYKMTVEARNIRLRKFEAETGQKLDAPTIHTTSWHEKVAFAQKERQRLAKQVENVTGLGPYVPIPKKPWHLRCVDFIKGIWKSANF